MTAEASRPIGPRPPFDRELLPFVDAMTTPPPLTPETIAFLRTALSGPSRATDVQLGLDGRFDVQDRLIPTAAGRRVWVTICVPTRGPQPAAVLFYLHSGGLIAGDQRHGLLDVVKLADSAGAAVVSVDYRLSPETQYPGALDDAEDALAWVLRSSGELAVDPARIVISGGSAGGGLAAALVLRLRDREGFMPRAQLLMCPMLDDRNDTASAVQMAGVPFWNRAANALAWSALLGPGTTVVSEYAAPARALDLTRLPPAYLDVGTVDTFRDETVEYASGIWRAGGDAELHVWPGGFHGFDDAVPEAQLSRAAVAAREQWLARILG